MAETSLPRETSARIGRPVNGLLTLGFLLAAGLLGRLAFDLGRRDALFGVLVWGFYACFLALGLAQLTGVWRADPGAALSRGRRIGLALAIPAGLLGAILDCMGLSVHGCSPVCTFLTTVLAPLIGLLALLHGLTAGSGWILGAGALSFGLLVPNCECYNPVNAFWIDALGRSPACFVSGFTVTLVASCALISRHFVRAALALAWSTIAVILVFFVGHHYFRWPW